MAKRTVLTPQEMIWRNMSEADVAVQVEGMFSLGGWHWYHPYTGESANTILDYVAWRERIIHVELKKMKGALTVDRIVDGHFVKGQVTVMLELKEAGQEVYLWRPSDLDFAQYVLVDEPRRGTWIQRRSEWPGTSR